MYTGLIVQCEDTVEMTDIVGMWSIIGMCNESNVEVIEDTDNNTITIKSRDHTEEDCAVVSFKRAAEVLNSMIQNGLKNVEVH